MVTPAVGPVVLVRFPFSDLSQSKLRPAVVLADAGRGDWILCQVTSNPYADARAVELAEGDFWHGRPPAHELCAADQALHRAREHFCIRSRGAD